jgi:hypothetical protein
MPQHNADGGGSHGYTQSPVTGWGRFYRDLMTGRVMENGRMIGINGRMIGINGRMIGITPEAWLSGTIRSQRQKISLINRIFKI